MTETTTSVPEPKTIVVLGAWSSGSTAVTGYLARLGAFTCPPHQKTNDPRTPDSHEPRDLRDALASFVDELELKPRRDDLTAFRPWFADWLAGQRERAAAQGCTRIVLKHPLAAFFVADMAAVCQPAFIVVTRRFDAIERSRRRRGWHPVYGAAGAKVIYQQIFNALITHEINALTLNYERFRSDPTFAGGLLTWTGLRPAEAAMRAARAWVR